MSHWSWCNTHSFKKSFSSFIECVLGHCDFALYVFCKSPIIWDEHFQLAKLVHLLYYSCPFIVMLIALPPFLLFKSHHFCLLDIYVARIDSWRMLDVYESLSLQSTPSYLSTWKSFVIFTKSQAFLKPLKQTNSSPSNSSQSSHFSYCWNSCLTITFLLLIL